MDVDQEAEEAAAILESLMGTAQEGDADAGQERKRKNSVELGAVPGRVCALVRLACPTRESLLSPTHPCSVLQKKRAKGKAGGGKPDANRIPANIDTLLCEICGAGHHEDKIILCDRCDKGFHLFCLSPPLECVPEGDWVCPLCSQQDNDNIFFRSGCKMTFKEMREWNTEFAKGWFGEDYDPVRHLPCARTSDTKSYSLNL